MRRRRCCEGESGASLVLALVFVTASGLVAAALVTLSGANMIATSKLQNLRGLQYSADGTLEVAIQTLRYEDVSSTTSSCTTSVTTMTVNGQGTTVWCQAGEPSTVSRQVDFCASTSSGAAASFDDCQNPLKNLDLVEATVLYNDLNPACPNPSPNPPTSSCHQYGTSVDIAEWVVGPSLS